MKIILITLIFIGTFISQGFSQTSIIKTLEVESYQKMKEQGTIPANFQFTNAETVFQPNLEDFKKGAPNDKSNSCGCYITPDLTYTLAMGPNDDGSTAALTIPFSFCLYGTNYSSLFINNNGNISFGSSYATFSSSPFPSSSYVMVAPFWGDVDTRGAGTVWYKITPTAMYINWEAVGYYSMATDKLNSFQLIITDGADPILPAGNNIAFCYGDMQWTTGAASGGVNGFGGTPATVGVNKGNGVDFIQLGRFDQPGSAYDGGGGLNDGVSWLDNQSFYFNVCSGTNIAPIPNFTPSVFNGSGGGACDTLRVCGINDTLLINSLFLSPEIGETTTVTINLNSTPGFTVLNNTPGNPAIASVQIIASPANAGMNTITYTAVDNGVPAQTTIVNLNIFVDTTGLSAFNPVISGVLDFCSGGGTTLNVSPTNYTSYIWNTGSIDTTLAVTTGGEYWVTSELNGCFKTVSVDVTEHQAPTPVILGALFTCTSSPTTLYVDSANLYTSFTWSNGSTNDSIVVLNGTYSITVTDSFGCTATSPSVTVTNNNPTVSITGNATFCQGDSTTLTAVPTIPSGASYLWSTGSTNNTVNVGSLGNVWVTINYSNGCFANDTIGITVVTPIFNSQNVSICQGGNYTLPGGSVVTQSGAYIDTLTALLTGCDSIVTTNLTVTPPISNSQNDTICQGGNYTLPGGSVVTQSGAYIDTLTVLSTGCDSIITTNLTVTPIADATISSVVPKCENNPLFNLNAASGGGVWSGNGITNSTNGQFEPSVAGSGQHEIIYTIGGNCGNADTITITVNPIPEFSFSSIEDTCLSSRGTILTTIISGTSPYAYLWSRGDITPNLFNVLSGTYLLNVTDGNGCSKSAQNFVGDFEGGCDVVVPNVITPNGDGMNDLLVFENLEYFPKNHLVVFNRWGIKLFETDNYRNDWDGDGHTDGTYYFILELNDFDNTIHKGSFTIFK